MFIFTSSFISSEISSIKDKISSAQYKAGSTWYDANVQKEISGNKLIVKFTIGPTTNDLNVTKVRLLDNNSVIAESNVSIIRNSATEIIDFSAEVYVFGIVKNDANTGEYDKQ